MQLAGWSPANAVGVKCGNRVSAWNCGGGHLGGLKRRNLAGLVLIESRDAVVGQGGESRGARSAMQLKGSA